MLYALLKTTPATTYLFYQCSQLSFLSWWLSYRAHACISRIELDWNHIWFFLYNLHWSLGLVCLSLRRCRCIFEFRLFSQSCHSNLKTTYLEPCSRAVKAHLWKQVTNQSTWDRWWCPSYRAILVIYWCLNIKIHMLNRLGLGCQCRLCLCNHLTGLSKS